VVFTWHHDTEGFLLSGGEGYCAAGYVAVEVDVGGALDGDVLESVHLRIPNMDIYKKGFCHNGGCNNTIRTLDSYILSLGDVYD